MFMLLITLITLCLQTVASAETDPILYAVDVGDGAGLVLLKKVAQRCPYYKSDDTNTLLLHFYSKRWEITRNAKPSISQTGCGKKKNTGTLLYTHEGRDMSNRSWVKVQEGKSAAAAKLEIYALEDCTSYKGVLIDGDLKSITVKNKEPSQCPKEAVETGEAYPPGNNVDVNLFTTTSQIDNLTRYNWCRYGNVKTLKRAFLILNETDENARVIVRGRTCGAVGKGTSTNNYDISQARIPTKLENSDAENDNTNTSVNISYLFWVSIVGGTIVGALIIGILAYYLFKLLSKNKEEKADGDYGMASIDKNFQYGEDEEYYQYHYSKKQTGVVDENEMYKSCEYDD